MLGMGLLVFAAAGGALANPASHPICDEMNLNVAELPAELYLVRSPVPLLSGKHYTVHGTSGNSSLVSGNREHILDLATAGCFVAPLPDLDRGPDPTGIPTQAPDAPAKSDPSTRPWAVDRDAEPAIQALVDQVEWEPLRQKIDRLVRYNTRYSYAPQCVDAANDLATHFRDLNLEVELQRFTYQGHNMYNCVATQVGHARPDSIFVLCGHYDSVSEDPYHNAPGADDNGTGTATLMTVAEILAPHSFAYTIKYICFAGEEQGLIGSQVYVSRAVDEGLNIGAALNYDMMGYWEPGVEADLEIESNDASVWLADIITGVAETYTGAAFELHVYNGAWWGDHYPFWLAGYAALNHEESWDWGDPDFNPYYHTSNDLIEYLGPDFVVANVKVAVASLATLADLADPHGTGNRFAGKVVLGAQPNPFNGRLTLSVAGPPDLAYLDLDIFDLRGRRVARLPVSLVDGHGTAIWAPDAGRQADLSSGVYFCRPRQTGLGEVLRVSYVK